MGIIGAIVIFFLLILLTLFTIVSRLRRIHKTLQALHRDLEFIGLELLKGKGNAGSDF